MTYADQLLSAADQAYLALPPWPEWDAGWTLRLGKPVTDAYVAFQSLCHRFSADEPALLRPVDLDQVDQVEAARRLRLELAEAFERFADAEVDRQAAVADGDYAAAIAARPHRAAWFTFWRELADLAVAVAQQLREQAEHLGQAAPEAMRPSLPPWPPGAAPAGPPRTDWTPWLLLAALAAISRRR